MSKQQIVEFEQAGDVKDFIAQNSDVVFADPEFKKTIQNADTDDILKISKTIDSPITIIAVQIVNDEFLKKEM